MHTHTVQYVWCAIVFVGIAVSLIWCEHITITFKRSTYKPKWVKEMGMRAAILYPCVYEVKRIAWILSIHISTTCTNLRRNISHHICMHVCYVYINRTHIQFISLSLTRRWYQQCCSFLSLFFPFIAWPVVRFLFLSFSFSYAPTFSFGIFSKIKILSVRVHFFVSPRSYTHKLATVHGPYK